MINRIGKITLYVNNQEMAKKFWVNKLGFIVKVEKDMGPNIKWIEVSPNEEAFTTFVLYDKALMKKQNPNNNVEHPSIILSTKTIDKTYENLKEREVKVGPLLEMPYGKMFSFKDEEENDYLVRED